MTSGIRLPLLLAALAMTLGCAAKRPVLYPNVTFQQLGPVEAEDAIDGCLDFAGSHGLSAHPERRAAGSTLKGSAVGAAWGASWGAIRGAAGSRAAAGAASGAAVGMLHGVFRWRDPDPIQARFVDRCLREQGYAVIGWR